MMGWIKKKGKQYWQETRTVGHKINAAGFEVAVRKYFTAQTKKECLAKVDDFMLQQKLNTTNSKKAFGVLADMWIEEFYKNGPNADSTKAMYIRNWNKHIGPMEFYMWPVSNIEGTIIDDFQIHMTVIMDDPIAQSVDVRPWDVGILFTKLIRQVFCVF